MANPELIPQQYFGYCWAGLSASRLSLKPLPWWSVGWMCGGDTAGTADTNQPKGCPKPYAVPLSNKSWRNWRRVWALGVMAFVIQSNPYTYSEPASLGLVWTSVPHQSSVKKFLLQLCFCSQFLLYIAKCLYFTPWLFSCYFLPMFC